MNKNESKYFKTAEKMHNALITLLDSKDFEYITIKEICETAGVNRSTFYLHYDNVNDLLQETVEAVYKDFFARFGAEGAESIDIDDKDNEKLFLVTPGYLMPYLNFVEENRKLFYLKGIIGVVTEWVRGGCSESKEEIIRVIQKCIIKP